MARVRSRLRGNNLHLLFECDPCPDAAVVMPKLAAALTEQPLADFLPAGSPQVYRVTVYGRVAAQATPQWTESLDVSAVLARSPHSISGPHPESSTGSMSPAEPTNTPVLRYPAPAATGNGAATSARSEGARWVDSIHSDVSSNAIEGLGRVESAPVESHRPVEVDATEPVHPLEPAAPLEPATGMSPGARPVSSLELAHQGHPAAISHYLSEAFSPLGIAIRARLEPSDPDPARSDSTQLNSTQPDSAKTTPAKASPAKRLTILCEAAYIPEPMQFVEALALRLRELELKGFREALVYGQVQGEAKPEWVLRVDLTPPERLLREWSRWGDVQAISRLLNRALKPQSLQVSALLKETTLHLACEAKTVIQAPDQRAPDQAVPDQPAPQPLPDKLTAVELLSPLLDTLGPQGIHAAALYGVGKPSSAPDAVPDAPLWVYWLDLPATQRLDLAPSTLVLAQQGNLEALTFLLNRLLNPQLDRMLTTGGVRVQVRQKGAVLHIMTDALNCPPQRQVAKAISKFLRPLHLSGILRVQVYGRTAGQKRPLWAQGIDYGEPGRLVPEATPEFAASDAYVGDLLTPAGPLVPYGEAQAHGWRRAVGLRLEDWRLWMQRSLVQSQLFVPLETLARTAVAQSADSTHAPTGADGLSAPPAKANPARAVAFVWAAIGGLVVFQADWIVGRLLQPAPTPKVAATSLAARHQETKSPAAQSPAAQSPAAQSPAAQRPAAQSPATPRSDAGGQAPNRGQSSINDAQAPSNLASSPDGDGGLPRPAPLPKLDLRKTKPANDGSFFSGSGFTKEGTTTLSEAPNDPSDDSEAKALTKSPLLPKAPKLDRTGPDPYPTFNSRQLDEKLALYQQFMTENGGAPDVLIMGSSRALRGVDPVALRRTLAEQGYTNVTVFNFGINGATAQVVDLVVRQMLPQEALPKVILWADGARAFNSGREDITYNAIAASPGFKTLLAGRPPLPGTMEAVAQSPKPNNRTSAASGTSSYGQLNQLLEETVGRLFVTFPQRDRLKTALRDQLATHLPKGDALSNNLANATSPAASASNAPDSVLKADQDQVDINGFLPLPHRFNPVTYYQKYARVPGDFDSDYAQFGVQGSQLEALARLSQFAQTRQIPLVFVNLPLTSDYLDATRRRYEEKFQQVLLKQSAQLGFGFRDMSGVMLTQNQFFSDPSHLNRYGGYAVSQRLAQDVMIPWAEVR
jgi:hypothetical protein